MADFIRDDEARDGDGDIVLQLLIEDDLLFEFADFAVHLGAGVPLALSLVEDRLVFALPPADDRGHDDELRPLGPAEDGIHDLLDCLPAERLAHCAQCARPMLA